MKLVSWNVNGLRAILKKDFIKSIDQIAPDVICLQEIKAYSHQVSFDDSFSLKHRYWNSAAKAGYSGTAIFSKTEPLSVTNGLGLPEYDCEGRTITAEFDNFFLVTVYVPNVKPTLERLDFRVQWDGALLEHLQMLNTKKGVIVCGDMNVAHKPIDLARPQSNRGHAGFTDEERAGMTNYVNSGFIDTFRHFNDRPHHYSWWSYRGDARQRNVGWRIDYFLASQDMLPKLADAEILAEYLGSDHCPVSLNIQD